MKIKLIALTAVLSAVSAPALAGEVYVQNSDIYRQSRGTSVVNISGSEFRNGVTKNFNGAIKIEEYDRDTNVSRGDDEIDIDGGINVVGSFSVDYSTYRRADFYRGQQRTSFREQGYTHEVTAGYRD